MSTKSNFKKQVRTIFNEYLPDAKLDEYSLSSLYREKINNKKSSSGKSKDQKQINFQISKIIDYAEERLSPEELFSFLMNLGKISIEQNELLLAAEINNQIILKSSKNTQFENISAYAVLTLSKIAFKKHDFDKSIKFLKKAKNIFIEQNDVKGIAKSEKMLADVYFEKRNYSKAKEHLNNAIEHFDYSTDVLNVSPIEFKLAEIEYILGNYDLAFTLLHRSLIKYEQFSNSSQVAIIRLKLGMVLFKKHEYESALVEFNKCLFLALKTNDLATLGKSYLKKSQVYNEMGEKNLAEAYAQKALEIGYKVDDKPLIANIFIIKGLIEKKKKHFDLAEDYIQTSYNINSKIGNEPDSAEALNELGKLFWEWNKKDTSAPYFNNAIKYYKKAGLNEKVSEIESFIKT